MRNEYLVAENRILRNQIQGRLRLTDVKRPGSPVLSPFVFLDTTGYIIAPRYRAAQGPLLG